MERVTGSIMKSDWKELLVPNLSPVKDCTGFKMVPGLAVGRAHVN